MGLQKIKARHDLIGLYTEAEETTALYVTRQSVSFPEHLGGCELCF